MLVRRLSTVLRRLWVSWKEVRKEEGFLRLRWILSRRGPIRFSLSFCNSVELKERSKITSFPGSILSIWLEAKDRSKQEPKGKGSKKVVILTSLFRSWVQSSMDYPTRGLISRSTSGTGIPNWPFCLKILWEETQRQLLLLILTFIISTFWRHFRLFILPAGLKWSKMRLRLTRRFKVNRCRLWRLSWLRPKKSCSNLSLRLSSLKSSWKKMKMLRRIVKGVKMWGEKLRLSCLRRISFWRTVLFLWRNRWRNGRDSWLMEECRTVRVRSLWDSFWFKLKRPNSCLNRRVYWGK